MPIYEYQGQQYDIATDDAQAAKAKILAHLGTSEPTPTIDMGAGAAFESNLLSPLLSLSRAFGGATAETQSKAVEQAEEYGKDHEVAAMGGKMAGLIGPLVPAMVAAPVLAPAAGLGGMGAGVAMGAAAAPIVGPATGMEKYQSLLNKGAPEEEARYAGITEGGINAASNMIPIPGLGLVGRMLAGGALNAGSAAGSTAIQNQILSDERLHQDPLDLKNMIIAGTLGAVTEGVGGNRPGDTFRAKTPPTVEIPTQKPSDSYTQYVEQLKNKRDSLQTTIDKLASVETPTPKQEAALEAMVAKQQEIESTIKQLGKEEGTAQEVTTPMDVANQKLDSVGDLPPEMIQKRLEVVEQKLADPNISEGQRGAMEVERQVYTEILGKQLTPEDAIKRVDEVPPEGSTVRPYVEGERLTEDEFGRLYEGIPDAPAFKPAKPLDLESVLPETRSVDEFGNDARPSPYRMTAEQFVGYNKGVLDKMDKSLQKINQTLNDYNEGKLPSGTVEVAELTKRKQRLETAISIRQEASERAIKMGGLGKEPPKPKSFLDIAKKVSEDQATAVKNEEANKAWRSNYNLQAGKKLPSLLEAVKSGDIKAGLEAIKAQAARPELKIIADALLKKSFLFSRKLGFNKNLPESTRASASQKTGDITFRAPETVNPMTYIHEILHSVTSGMIVRYANGERFSTKTNAALKSLFSLYNEIKTNHAQHLTETMGSDIARIVLKNEQEFLAHGTTSPMFMAYLNNIKVKKSNGLSALADSIGEIFGWSKAETTALKKLYEVTDKLITQSKGELVQTGKMDYTNDVDVKDSFWNKVGVNAFTAQAHIIYKNNPVIQEVHNIIKDANRMMDYRYNKINGGTITQGQYKGSNKLWLTHRKLSSPDGWAAARIATPEAEMTPVIKALIEGHDNIRGHEDTFALYKDQWTPAQQNFFKAIVRTQDLLFKYENDWRHSVGLDRLKYKTGHFPAIRNGEHYVVMSRNGVPYHAEPFISKVEADKFLAKEKAAGNTEAWYQDSKTSGNKYDDIMNVLQDVQDAMEKKGMHVGLAETRDKLMAGKASATSSAMHRSGIPGYIGTEIGIGGKDIGKRFAENYDGYIKQRLEGLRNREIIYNRDQFYAKDTTAQDMPNAQKLADVMVDSQTGQIRGPEWLQDMGKWAKEVVDRGAASIFKMDKRSTHVLDRLLGVSAHVFYAHNVTMKPAIWVAQVSQYLNGMRGLPELNLSPLEGTIAIGKGLGSILSGKNVDKDLVNAVMWASQNTNSLHPQLRNELNNLHVGKDPNSAMNRIIDLVSGETFSGAADSFSRFATFVTYYHALKDKGLSGPEMWRKAADITDDNMFMYGKREQPAMYKNLGIVGEQMTPLKTFAHGQAGLMVADMKNFIQSPSFKTAGPLAVTALMTTLMGGLISAPIVAEYEALRRILVAMKIIKEDTFPNVTEIFLKAPPSVAYGPVSGATGVDIGASMRYNSLLGGLVTSQDVVNQLFPALGFVEGLGVNVYKKLAGKISGDMPEAESKWLANKLAPKGYVKGLLDLPDANERSMVPFGPRGEGLVPQTNTEKVANILGSRSVDEARATSEYLLQQEKKKARQGKIGKGVDFILEGETQKGIERLVDAQVDPNTIKNLLSSQMLKQQRPVLERFVTDKKGQVSSYEQKRRMMDMIEYFEATQ